MIYSSILLGVLFPFLSVCSCLQAAKRRPEASLDASSSTVDNSLVSLSFAPDAPVVATIPEEEATPLLSARGLKRQRHLSAALIPPNFAAIAAAASGILFHHPHVPDADASRHRHHSSGDVDHFHPPTNLNPSGNLVAGMFSAAAIASMTVMDRCCPPYPPSVLEMTSTNSQSTHLPSTYSSALVPQMVDVQPDAPQRPFRCDYCGKAFKLRHHMKDHCRVHTGERPFPCHLCGKTFSRSTILKAHEKTHLPKADRLHPPPP